MANTRKDNKNKRPVRGAITRKIIRNAMRKKAGSNKIHDMWLKYQLKKYGAEAYDEILRRSRKGA